MQRKPKRRLIRPGKFIRHFIGAIVDASYVLATVVTLLAFDYGILWSFQPNPVSSEFQAVAAWFLGSGSLSANVTWPQFLGYCFAGLLGVVALGIVVACALKALQFAQQES